MRKFILSLVAVAVLGTGSAFAQSDMWVGVSTGFPLGVAFHVGFDDLIGPDIDLRGNITGSFGSAGGVSAFGVVVGADVLFNLDEFGGTIPLNPYAGGGLLVALYGAGGMGASAGGFGIGVTGVAGIEYLFVPELGVFFEGRVGAGYGSVAGFGGFMPFYGVSLGVNYHF